MPVSIIYEDRQLLVIRKPPGLLSQPDGTPRGDVLAWAEEHLRAARGKPSAWVGLVHRLDFKVGGVMALAKTSKAAARLSLQFRERKAKKAYLAAIEGEAPAEGIVEGRLVREGRLTRAALPEEDGRGAKLAFGRLGVFARDSASLLIVNLLTGFKHQIRAQLSALGHPVLGDELYGGRPSPDGGEGIGLWAARLALDHPITGERIRFDCQPPRDWPFNLFDIPEISEIFESRKIFADPENPEKPKALESSGVSNSSPRP